MSRQIDLFPGTNFIEQVELRRVRLGLPIETLCRRADIGTRSYHYWLAGKVRPTETLRRKIEEALGDYERARRAS